MAEFLVSASTGVMKSLLSKLATMMSDEYKLHKDLRRDIKFLKDELAVMHAFLTGMADIKEPDEMSKLRVRVVRELSYDIEDHVDKFMQLDDHESSSNDQGFRKLMKKSKKLIKDFKIRQSIGKEVKDMKHQVMEVSDRFGRYSMDDACCSKRKAEVDPRVVALFKDASELVGMDGPRADLIKWLKNQEGDAAQPKVLSIVGAGGLGKTTLATQIYNELQVNFDCHAIVSISRNPDFTKIFCSILSDIGCRDTIPTEAPKLIQKIREILKNKRYFIIIDDIWDRPTWESMEPVFFKNSCSSRIMVTTRINEVAKSCCSNHEDLVYQIKPLGVADSRKLFFNRIFGCEEKCPSNLREASNEILRKCGGLPLAIITISSLLETMKTKADKWDRVRRSPGFGFDMGSEVDRMRGILGLSYFELPPHLRSCLLYFAQFPEDYVIRRYRIVHRWIAEGFIHCEDGQDLLEFGDSCFHDLVNRSLVQPLDIAYDGKAMACRVHDTILDFLIQKSTEDNFSTLLSSHSKVPHLSGAKIRRLSLQENDSEGIVTISPELNTSHLRSLSVFVSKQLSFIMNFSYLRVLDLEDCAQLEDHHLINISRLCPQLRYLNISYTGISAIPAEIGILQYLEILLCKLGDGFREVDPELPETVTQLARLVRLFVSVYTTLPYGIGRWKSLQYLEVIDPNNCSVEFLQDLGELIHLRYLSIKCDSWYSTDNREELVSSLRKLDACNLRDLSLHLYFDRLDDVPEGEFSFPALQSIRRVTLILFSYEIKISKFTKWLVSLANLEYLYIHIQWKGIEQEDLQLIGSISTLLYFGLSLVKTWDDHGPTIIRGGFQQLQRFSFECYKYEQRLMIQEGAMPIVKDIELSIYSPYYTTEEEVLESGIQHLPCSSIRIDTYDSKTTSSRQEAEGAFKSMVETHANHPTLLLTPCCFGYEGSIKRGHLSTEF